MLCQITADIEFQFDENSQKQWIIDGLRAQCPFGLKLKNAEIMRAGSSFSVSLIADDELTLV